MTSWILVLTAWLRADPFIPHPCVHDVLEDSPRFTLSDQAETRRLLDFVARRLEVHEDFRKLLHLVVARESSYRQGLVHQLPQDLEASQKSFAHTRKFYEGNPAKDPAVWQTYGLMGMNSNYFTLVWNKQADPRVLCDAIVDVLVYRRSAARMLRKISGNTIVCKDALGRQYDYPAEATWQTLHRAVSGGKLCPSKHEDSAVMQELFRGRAARFGLDPDRPVSAKMLGREPDGWGSQEAMVMGLWREFELQERRGRT